MDDSPKYRELHARLIECTHAIRTARAAGDCREVAVQLLDRCWVEMGLRDLWNSDEGQSQSWAYYMCRDLEAAQRAINSLLRSQRHE